MKKLIQTTLLLLSCAPISGAQSLAYSPDGRTLAAIWRLEFEYRQDVSQVIAYDAASGRRKSAFVAVVAPSHLAVSPDGRSLAYAGPVALDTLGFAAGDGALKDSLNMRSGENFDREMNEQQNNGREFLGVAFSADGKIVYKLNSHFLNAYEAADLKFLPDQSRRLEEEDADSPAWSQFVGMSETAGHVVESEYKTPDVSLVVRTTGGGEAARFKLPYQIAPGDIPTISAGVSRNGATLAARYAEAGSVRGQITLWDLKNRRPLGVFGVPALDRSYENQAYLGGNFALSPNGKKIAARFLGTGDPARHTLVVVRDVFSGRESVLEFAEQLGSEFAEAIVFSPDSKHVATFSTVLTSGSFAPKIHVWDAETGKLVRALE